MITQVSKYFLEAGAGALLVLAFLLRFLLVLQEKALQACNRGRAKLLGILDQKDSQGPDNNQTLPPYNPLH